MAEHMINEAMIHLARERLLRSGYLDAVRRICAEEPDLHYAISRYAVDALGSLEGLPSEAHDASHRAVWEAALLAVESYRLAHYRLWRGTELGTLLERSDPSLANESGDEAVMPAIRRKGDAVTEPEMAPEMLVRTEDLLAALAAVNREGADGAIERLRAREPVLTKYLLESWDKVYAQLRRQPQVPERCSKARQKLTVAILVAFTAQQKAQYRLWHGTAVGTLLEQIDPNLGRENEDV